MAAVIMIYVTIAFLVFLNAKFAYESERKYRRPHKRYVFKRWKDLK